MFDIVGLVSTSPNNNRLADFVRSQMKIQGAGYREIANKSGGLITYGTVFDVVNNRTKSPTLATLQGLAKGLGVTEEEIFSIARGVTNAKSSEKEELLFYINALTPARTRDLLAIAKIYYHGHLAMTDYIDTLRGIESAVKGTKLAPKARRKTKMKKEPEPKEKRKVG